MILERILYVYMLITRDGQRSSIYFYVHLPDINYFVQTKKQKQKQTRAEPSLKSLQPICVAIRKLMRVFEDSTLLM